ncbi:MAG: methyl-accepting chemotaxis protein [Limisphaerales bacterium]
MKLQTKFVVALVGAILVVFVGGEAIQQTLSQSKLSAFARQNLQVIDKAEQEHANDIARTMNVFIKRTIAKGEMSELVVLVTNFSDIKGLLEYSIYDHTGVASFSTHHDFVKSRKELSPEIKAQVLAKTDNYIRRTDEAFEIYQPIEVTKSCLECHDDLKAGTIGGVGVLRVSTKAVETSKADWNLAAAGIRHSDTVVAGVGTIAIVLFSGVLVWLTVRTLVTRPLHRIITALARGAEEVHSASAEISNGSHSLAEGASEQAASLEETGASLEEITSMTRHNSENAQKANELAKDAHRAADRGVADMQSMKEAMEAIKGSGDSIGKIIKTIDEIAFQTNILALNAAVEAARAGEAGLSFAVVADEVRTLAQRCAEAARETSSKIENAFDKTSQGMEINGKVAAALQEIVTKAHQVNALVGEVASASREQNQGIAQINAAVSQMDKVTQSNAANAEESAAAAQELKAQAQTLNESVADLLCLVEGNHADMAGSWAPPVRRNKLTPPMPKTKRGATPDQGDNFAPSNPRMTGNGRNDLQLQDNFHGPSNGR